MSRWRSAYQGFDVDSFCDPSGRGRQAPAFCSIVDESFAQSFKGLKFFASAPLHLVAKFLQSSLDWGAERLVAVLPMRLAQEAGLGQCLLRDNVVYWKPNVKINNDLQWACCTHTDLSKEFSHALKAITRVLAPRWVSQWVFLILSARR